MLEEFDNVHSAMDNELVHTLVFLDASLKRHADDAVQRSVHCERTWTWKFTHFLGFVPLNYKSNLMLKVYETKILGYTRERGKLRTEHTTRQIRLT